MNLIANSGIQLWSSKIEFNPNINFRMFFNEYWDEITNQLVIELAHHFSEEDIWVKKKDLKRLGRLNNQDGTLNSKWVDIEPTFRRENLQTLRGNQNCFSINSASFGIEKFENIWLPMPFFKVNAAGTSLFGPRNWCKFKIVPVVGTSGKTEHQIILAFDTKSEIVAGGTADAISECPVFNSEYDKSIDFSICKDEFLLLEFISPNKQGKWISELLLKLFHGVNDVHLLTIPIPHLKFLAQYLFLVRYIQKLDIIPTITLFNDKNNPHINVDLVVDIGNSKTCAILFDESDVTKVEHLSLQNFSNISKDGVLNTETDSFDMRLAFNKANFGTNPIGSKQFNYPSFVRLGKEAKELIHQTVSHNTGVEQYTTFSSPKRFLWDTDPQSTEWAFIRTNENDKTEPRIWIEGISNQLNSDGTISKDGRGGVVQYYSRSALMTFCFIEILMQAKIQINSYRYRKHWGAEGSPRKINKIVVTCPTAMSIQEQNALRKAAQDASLILHRYFEGASNAPIGLQTNQYPVKIIPSANINNTVGEVAEWIYDEATCAQLLYLYSEVNERYNNNAKEFFRFRGKKKIDGSGSTVTIGSVDIGAGTTDLMIAEYHFDGGTQCTLKPIPKFWESFYTAGDDLVKKLIETLIIQGSNSTLQEHFSKLGILDISKKINLFFGKDTALMSITDRKNRSDFNIQISIPIVSHYLELLKENKVNSLDLSFEDIFGSNPPSENLIQHFNQHFGCSFKNITWKYEKSIVSEVVESIFNSLISKISTLLAYYQVDIVLLSGRPTSLNPITKMFLKYFSVSPNRLISMNNYRIGTWYPFQDGNGHFKDVKSMVAVGAMIGFYTSNGLSLKGFSIDLSDLASKMKPTTDFFSLEAESESLISPEVSVMTLTMQQIPFRIYTRQLDSKIYPTRPFYQLSINKTKLKEIILKKENLLPTQTQEIQERLIKMEEDIQRKAPYTFKIIRENYIENKEKLTIESVLDRNKEEANMNYFTLQIQSLMEGDQYWMDNGAFDGLFVGIN